MILLKISEIQKAMAHLLIRTAFDECYLEQAEVLTFAKLTMQGGRNPNWYDEAPADDRVRWKECKPTIFTYIKGDRTPTMMRISLKASAEFAEKLLENSGVYDLYLQEKPMLQLQFRYEKQELVFVTGITHAEFTMDKRIEFAWDAAVEQYVRSLGGGAERG